jgi:hypothetical protein
MGIPVSTTGLGFRKRRPADPRALAERDDTRRRLRCLKNGGLLPVPVSHRYIFLVSRPKDREALRIEKSCPLASAHTRLRQAHDLWHRTVASYAVPEDFVLNLNNLITTLRQVTFMLQTQKASIPDFEEWYVHGWRRRMQQDPIMVWLHDARTKIEHVGDLDVASTALVTVIASWLDGPYAVFEVPPHIGPEEIASNFSSADIPDPLRKEGLLKVERQWVSNDLPEHELTDVCAHGYGVVSTILAEAHERLGIEMRTFGGETHEGPHHRSAQSGGRLPCMLISREERTAHLHLGKGDLVDLEEVEIDMEITDERAALFLRRSEQMLIDPKSAFAFGPDEDPLDVAGRLSTLACRNLAHDGYHDSLAFFFGEGNELLGITQLNFSDQAEKYLAFRNIASEAERSGAATVIQVGEVWEARVDKKDVSPTMKRASERPDRSEALSVIAATSDGRERTYSTPFTRDGAGKPVLGKTRALEGPKQLNASFLPLKAMWRAKA